MENKSQLIENEYRFNKRFRDYVNRYADCTGVSIKKKALTHNMIKNEIYPLYTEL